MLLSTFNFRNAANNQEIAALFKAVTKDCNLNPCCLALLEANNLIHLSTQEEQKIQIERVENNDWFTKFKELKFETP